MRGDERTRVESKVGPKGPDEQGSRSELDPSARPVSQLAAVTSELRAMRGNLAAAFFTLAFLVLAGAYQIGILPTRAPPVAAGVVLALTLVIDGTRRLVRYQRRFLWRISRKLIVSYSLIAIVPVVLLVFVFVFVSYLAAGQFIAFMSSKQLDELIREVEQTRGQLASNLEELVSLAPELDSLREAAAEVDDPGEALVPLQGRFENVTAQAVVRSTRTGEAYIPPGLEWPPGNLAQPPAWLAGVDDFESSLVLVDERLEVRGAARRTVGDYEAYVEVSVPLDDGSVEVLQRYTGMDIRIVKPLKGGSEVETMAETGDRRPERSGWFRAIRIFGVLVVQPRSWREGLVVREGRLIVTQRSVSGLYRDLYELSAENRLLIISVLVLLLVGLVVFETVTLAIGVSLARSITGAIHELSQGTRRIEAGDLGHRIRVWTDDQLGELSRSFNRMAVSVEKLVRESAERERLEEELRIGREIQKSLLPGAEWSDGRFEIAALSIPAKEVGGDYYDFFETGQGENFGLLVADVSGKGTEAAFYMAEVKGIMLAVTHRIEHPAEVLEEANVLLSASLDRRTFVSMTYAVLDRKESVLEFARAGHSPLLHLKAGSDRVETHQPGGLALGVDRSGRFAQHLEPRSIRLDPGDIVLFFTDGVTDTLGPDGEFYEQARLERALLRAQGEDAATIRDQLAADLHAFAIEGPPHDDLTLIVLRVL